MKKATVVLASFLATVVPGIVLAGSPRLEINGLFLFGASVAAYAGIRIAIASSKSNKIVETMFWVFIYVWFGIAPMIQGAIRDFPWHGVVYEPKTREMAYLVVIIGILGYESGLWLSPKQPPEGEGLWLRPNRVLVAGLAGIIIPIVTITFLVGWRNMFTNRVDFQNFLFARYGQAGGIIITEVIRTPAFVGFVALAWLLWNRIEYRIIGLKHIAVLTLSLAIVVPFIVANNPLIHARFWIGTISLSMGGAFLQARRRVPVAVIAVLMVALLVIVFPYSDLFRSRFEKTELSSPAEQLGLKGDYDAFQQTMNTVSFVQDEGPQGGKQLVGSLGGLVPRAWWPNKPIDSGDTVALHAGVSFVNLSSPLFAEGYIDFGFLGAAGYMFLFARLTRTLDSRLYRSHSASWTKFMVFFFAFFQFFILRGDLLSSLSIFTLVTLALLFPSNASALVWKRISRLRTHSAGREIP